MDNDWLEDGHGIDGGNLHRVEIGTPSSDASWSTVSPAPRGGRRGSKRARTALVATTWGVVVLGATGLTVQAALFPSSGTPTGRSVWSNPGRVDDRGTDDGSSTESTDDSSSTSSTESPSTDSSTTSTTAVASPPVVSIDDHGSGGHGADDHGTGDDGSDDRRVPTATSTTIDDDDGADDDDDATSTTIDDDDDATSSTLDDATSTTLDDATSTTIDDHSSGGHGSDDAVTSTTLSAATPTSVDDHGSGGHGSDG